MSKYCPIAKQNTNCTDNCHYCLEQEENNNYWNEAVDFITIDTDNRKETKNETH